MLQVVMPLLLQFFLNKIFYQESALKSARVRLINKILAINLKELQQPLIIIFSKKNINILTNCFIKVDCIIKTTLTTLIKIKDINQLSVLINSGEIVLIGDMQVIYYLSILINFAQWDPVYYLSFYVDDILAEGISRYIKYSINRINKLLSKIKYHFKDVLIEEWRLFPNKLEFLSFTNKLNNMINDIVKLEQNLVELEDKYEDSRN